MTVVLPVIDKTDKKCSYDADDGWRVNCTLMIIYYSHTEKSHLQQNERTAYTLPIKNDVFVKVFKVKLGYLFILYNNY